MALSYFQTQKKQSPKQARWQDFLAEFDIVLEYKPGRMNQVADVLSRKAELAALMVDKQSQVSQVQATLLPKIREELLKDPATMHDPKAAH